ncbi:MAG: winged helix-turn-helix transcriptional regulator [Planctomycetota bacterium]
MQRESCRPPPRIEYTLNERGRELTQLADRIDRFVDDWARPEQNA